MAKILKTTYLGTTRNLITKEEIEEKKRVPPDGCLYTFSYRSKTGTDSNPLIIMTSPKWAAKKGGFFLSGVNLNRIGSDSKKEIIAQFAELPVGSVSYEDIKKAVPDNPECCIRTYDVRKVRALHKVEV